MAGGPSGLVMTYYYEKIEVAETVRVYAGQEGSYASIALVGDGGIVPSGKVQLRMAYTYNEPELGFLVSAYEYVEMEVSGGAFTEKALKNLSREEHYGSYFNLTATYTSSDGTITEKSSKASFIPI